VELELMSNPAGCFIYLAENYRFLDMIEEYQYCIVLDLYETRLPWRDLEFEVINQINGKTQL
jgi:hypothetical protein